MNINKFKYYEIVASCLYNIDPIELFYHTRGKEEVVTARQLCIYYRNKILKLGPTMAAKRYHRKHCTALHNVKVVESKLSKKGDKPFDIEFSEIFKRFMDICNNKREEEQDDIKIDGLSLTKRSSEFNIVMANIFKNFICLQKECIDFMDGYTTDETSILEYIPICRQSLDEIEKLFNNN